jgi:2-aminoadipate transaminase
MPKDLAASVCDRKSNEDFGSPNFNQYLIGTVIEEGLYDEHVEIVRRTYRQKRDAMLDAADKYFSSIPDVRWVRPNGGLYIWMTLPAHIDTGFEGELFARATSTEKVMYVPGDLAFAGSNRDERENNHMRLSFGVCAIEEIDEGMRRLASAVRAIIK